MCYKSGVQCSLCGRRLVRTIIETSLFTGGPFRGTICRNSTIAKERLTMSLIRTRSMMMIALVATMALWGCGQKSGYKTAEVASKRLGDTKSEVVAAKTQISDTVASLNGLVNNPQPDLRPQFEKF